MSVKKTFFRARTGVSVIEPLTGSFILIMSNFKRLNKLISTSKMLTSKNPINATTMRKFSPESKVSTRYYTMNLKQSRTKRFAYKFLINTKTT